MALLKEERLSGVKSPLVTVVKEAAVNLPFDLFVVEGLRTKERQAILVKEGKSRTLASKHLTGDAVDLVPMVNGKILWEDRKLFRQIRDAMLASAKKNKVRIRGGHDWDMNGVVDEEELAAYVKKFGRKPLVDWPHWELV